MVIQIAKAELRNLFYSPVAWFLAIVFWVLCAWFFMVNLYPIAKGQEAMIDVDPGFKDFGPFALTYLFFLAPEGVYMVVLKNLFLFVPLLTMGLIGREVHANTIKLLYSSPVKLKQVVAGKFLAVMTYNLILVLILGIFMITWGFSVRSVDYGLLLTGALAFYLLTCSFTAIGLFMSSLTNYQILAAAGTFIVIFILARINTLWQHIDFVRDLTYFLYMPGRTNRMFKGLIASKDVIYFVLVILMFLAFTLIRLKAQREVKPWYVKLGRALTVLVVALGIGYALSRPATTLYWDTTAMKLNTIHQNTQAVLSKLDEAPLEITLYVNLLGGEATYGFPNARNEYINFLWEQYQRFKTDIVFKYVYYYYYDKSMDGGGLAGAFPGKDNDEIAADIAKGYHVNVKLFQPPIEIKKLIDLEPEGHRLVMQLKYKDRKEYLRTYKSSSPFPVGKDQVWPREQNIAATLKKLADPAGIPKILFTCDNLERNIYSTGEREYSFIHNYKLSYGALINLGFNIDTISLENENIPADIDVLVVADPKTEFSSLARQKIEKYIDDGGNIVFTGEPGKQQMLNPLLRKMGVEMLDGILVEPTYDEMPHFVKTCYTAPSAMLADEQGLIRVRKDLQNKYSKDTAKMLMPGVAALSYSDSNGFVKKPLMLTVSNNTWIKKGKLVVDSAEVVYSPQEGDIKGAFPTALQLTRQVGSRQQRAAILSDADYVSNTKALNGETFHRGLFSWLTNNEYPVYAPREDARDNLMTISSRKAKVLGVVYIYIVPSIMLAAAIVLLVRRKRK